MKECYRVSKPGATALVWAIPRTSHWTATAIENAGWEIKDIIMHIFGSGFPKATDVLKSGEKSGKDMTGWNGWKSHGLKPAAEHWIMAMKPNEGSYADNALRYGVAGLNINGARIPCSNKTKFPVGEYSTDTPVGKIRNEQRTGDPNPQGRFPTNVILSCECDEVIDNNHTNPDCPCYMLDEQSGKTKGFNDTGGASRFFYQAKASRSERNMGCEGLEDGQPKRWNKGGEWTNNTTPSKNNHPTVKPLKLMEYLCLLTKTPKQYTCEDCGFTLPIAFVDETTTRQRKEDKENDYNLSSLQENNKDIKCCPKCGGNIISHHGIVLDCFAGSGTTCMAAKKMARDFIGIEKEKEYCVIAEARIGAIQKPLF
jgi:site-specific DNA-methyltransferase (adenine-specific)